MPALHLPNPASAGRRLLQTAAGTLILACSTDDLTGPSIADRLEGRRIAVSAVNGKIAFDSDRDGNDEIYVMNPDGTGQTRLTNNVAFDLQPAWSPDGTKIAFQSTRDGNPEIYVMNADGTGPTRLTNQSGSDLDAAWSPDGTKIAFERLPSFGAFDIYVMNANGTGQIQLTFSGAIDPAWSPDGTKIAFSSSRDGNLEIYVMNPDGTGVTRLTNDAAIDGAPAWSPDGSKIAFTHGGGGVGNPEVYVMNADGTGPTNLTNDLAIDTDPAWSPDGTKIAFRSNRDGDFEIFVMNADGSIPVPLTDGQDANPHWGVAAGGGSTTCAEAVSEARSRIAQLIPDRPFLRAFLNFLLTRMQAGFPNAERNFGLLLDLMAQLGLITPQEASELKSLVAPC